jgi:glycosyltransferase involved in cell wall biosynthesis
MSVSIALCTFNGEKFLPEQLRSITTQTILPDEIVVCDDGSKDNTVAIVSQFAQKMPEIHWHIEQNVVNLKTSKNFEKAISLCNNDFIFLADQDDVWKENKIESMLAFFRKNPGCKAVFSDADLIDDNDHQTGGTLLENSFFKSSVRKNYRKEDFLYWSIMLGNVMTGATMALRRSAFSSIFPFHLDPGRKLWHDGWIGFSLLTEGAVEYLDECLMKYRVHSSQQVGVVKRKDPFESQIMELKHNYDPSGKGEYFPRYLNAYSFLNAFGKIKSIDGSVRQRIEGEYEDEKRKYFKSQAFLLRKLRLLKWYIMGVNHISWRDLVEL